MIIAETAKIFVLEAAPAADRVVQTANPHKYLVVRPNLF